MKEYASIRHATSNEDGLEEITLEEHPSLWRVLMAALFNHRPRTFSKSYVCVKDNWRCKDTNKAVPINMQYELIRCKFWVTHQDWKI